MTQTGSRQNGTIRAFIALPLPPSLPAKLEDQTRPLRQALGRPLVRWTPTGNMHLTVKFLGETPQSQIPALAQALDQAVGSRHSFSLRIHGLGVFPNISRPRVIWVGVEVTAALSALQQAVEAAAGQIGCAADRRPFAPHLTLGRVNERACTAADRRLIRRVIESATPIDLGTIKITVVHLYRSTLKSTGAVYRVLHSCPLKES